METTKLSYEELRAALQQARAQMPDTIDLPRTWSTRQVEEHEERARLLSLHEHGLRFRSPMLDDLTRRRTALQASLGRLRAAEKTIDQQIASATDWRTVADPRERDAEWARQQGLLAAKRALHHGVEFFNGHPALPEALRVLFTETCATCGHSELAWPGPIPSLEDQIAELAAPMAEHEMILKNLVAGAEALLSEPVTTS